MLRWGGGEGGGVALAGIVRDIGCRSVSSGPVKGLL